MVKEPEKTVISQYCLDVVSLSQFIQKLPKGLKIVQLSWRAVLRKERLKLNVPEYFKKMGVIGAVQEASPLNVRGSIKAYISHDTLLKNIKTIAKGYHIPEDKFHILNITIMDAKNTSSVSFKRMYKQIRLPNDKRRKKLVLGYMRGDGKDPHDLLTKMSTKKVVCTMMKVDKSIVMCSEEMVVK